MSSRSSSSRSVEQSRARVYTVRFFAHLLLLCRPSTATAITRLPSSFRSSSFHCCRALLPPASSWNIPRSIAPLMRDLPSSTRYIYMCDIMKNRKPPGSSVWITIGRVDVCFAAFKGKKKGKRVCGGCALFGQRTGQQQLRSQYGADGFWPTFSSWMVAELGTGPLFVHRSATGQRSGGK